MIDPPSWTAPQSLRNDGTQCRKRCCICLCSCLFVFCLLLYVLTILMIAVKLLPFGVSPLILFGLGALREQGGVCPGSASAYRLEEAWIGGGDHSFFDLDTWDYWYGGVDPTGGPTEYVDHATAMANGLLEEGDGVVLVVGVERADVAHVHLAAALAGSTMARSVRGVRGLLRSALAGVAAHVIAGRERAGAAAQRLRDVEPLRKLRRRRELPRGNGAESRR